MANLIKKYKTGIMIGAFIGLAVAVIYKLFIGEFSFELVNLQSRGAALNSLSEFQLSQFLFFNTAIAWIIVGAVIGLFVDMKFGLNFSKKTRKMIMVALVILLLVSLNFSFGTGESTSTTERGAKLPKVGGTGWFGTLAGASGGFLFFLGFIIDSILGIFRPQPAIPIWVFFVGGFLLLLMFQRRQPEQPLIIQR